MSRAELADLLRRAIAVIEDPMTIIEGDVAMSILPELKEAVRLLTTVEE